MTQIRSLSVADLMPRAAVGLDTAPLRQLVAGRRVLVTGAGGSIGSELCRQLAALAPARLILLERHENSLYDVANGLRDRERGCRESVAAVVADITDETQIRGVFEEHRPGMVFHAAAHKHVPLMEDNPCEAVKNNVGGTRRLMNVAEQTGVGRFVLISSDKAVNPTSVMGATKRIAELMAQVRNGNGPTAFITVRFGNVLGSNGSVVPRFLEQIRAGGPVTVTHPEARRFFMLIPEAVQLVLHAAVRGQPGATYVLEMGEPMKILDLARNLIRLSGFVPDEDIAIRFSGLRPGEKLDEELVGPDEVTAPSALAKILRVEQRTMPDPRRLHEQVRDLEEAARSGSPTATLDAVRVVLPRFGKDRATAAVHQEPTAPAPKVQEHSRMRYRIVSSRP